MKKLKGVLKTKIVLISGVVAGLVVGGAATAAVMAAIPDNSGVIHGCYKNSNGSLKVIDNSTDACSGGETALNWSQTNEPLAYGVIDDSDNLIGSASKNIVHVARASNGSGMCFEVNFMPKNVQVSSGSDVRVRGLNDTFGVLDENVGPNGEPRCASTDNIWTGAGSSFFISIF